MIRHALRSGLGSLLGLAVCLPVANGIENTPNPPAPGPIVIPAQKHSRDNAQCVAMSPDGKLVAGAFGGPTNGRFPQEPRGGGIAIWDTATGQRRHFVGEYGDVVRMEFSPDSKYLLYARVHTPGDSLDEDIVRVIDVATGEVRHRWEGQAHFQLLPGVNEVLIGISDFDSDSYSLADFQQKRRYDRHYARCSAVAGDGTTFAALHYVRKPIIGRDGAVVPGGKLLKMWGLSIHDATSGRQRIGVEREALEDCFAMALSPSGKLLVTGHPRGLVRFMETEKLTEIHKLQLNTPHHVYPTFSPDGKTLAVATQPANGLSWTYDRNDPTGFKFEQRRPGAECEVVFIDTDTLRERQRWRFLDGSYRTWYARFGRETTEPEYNTGRFVYSPDGKHLLAGCNGVVLVDVASGKVVRQYD